MSLTPFEAASAWIWVPTVLSFGAMTRTFAPCVMSACACASSVASLPCALSILNSDELYPAIWKAFVKYGKSELTQRVDEVVSGMRTPTRPLPAACKSFRVAMAVKLTSNEETLRDDGMVAGDAVPVVVLPPHAVATIPTTPSVGTSLENLIWFLLLCKCHLSPSSRRSRGESAPANRPYSEAMRERPARKSIAHPRWFVKSAMVWPKQFVQTLDKPPWVAMIRIRAMPKKGEGSLAWLRDRNRERVVGVLRERGRISQADIARVTGLSRTTVHTLVSELKDSGLLREVEAGVPDFRGGRPSVLLMLRESSLAVLGIDFGHSHVGVAVADIAHNVLAERRCDLDVSHDARAALDAAARMVDEVLTEARVERKSVI